MKALLAIFLLAASFAGEPDQAARWSEARINPKDSIRLDQAVSLYRRNEYRYAKIAAMKPGTVPAIVLFCLHMREADNNFRTNPGQGDSLLHRSIHVPRGRIPAPAEPPFTFEQAAEDAYFVTDHLDRHDWRTIQGTLDACEGFNGYGYRKYGIPSPYLFAATTIEKPGKFVSDGRFSRTARDSQLGVVAVLLRMRDRGIAIPFGP